MGFARSLIEELWGNSSEIPDGKGVYLVLNQNQNIDFLEKGVGGFFKGEDPNVLLDFLQNPSNWIYEL